MLILGFPGPTAGKECTCNAGELGWEDPLKKWMATHSSVVYGQRSLADYSP